MKILFVGHDISYARFYEAVQLSLETAVNVSASHIYFRPSAWLYAKYLKKFDAFTPSGARYILSSKCQKRDNYSEIDLSFYGHDLRPDHKKKIKNLFQLYCDQFSSFVKTREFDIAVLPGEFRLFEQAIIEMLKMSSRPPKLIFMEAGPQGYIYFDKSGVNAKASFAESGINSLNEALDNLDGQTNCKEVVLKPLSKILRYSLLGVDIFWLTCCKVTGNLVDLEEYWIALCNRLKKLFAIKNTIVGLQNCEVMHFILFLGQVRNDVNHTHFGVSDIELEKSILQILDDDKSISIIWRDHPYERLDAVFLSVSSKYPGRIFRSSQSTLNEELNRCEGVVTVNSNGGLEALSFGLPVLLLGRSYYACLTGASKSLSVFKKYRHEIRVCGPNKSIAEGAKYFLRRCFLPIDYRLEDFRNANLAARLLMMNK